jgi:outer membrane beta-barrel protein
MKRPLFIRGFKCGLIAGLVAILGAGFPADAQDDKSENTEESITKSGTTVEGARRKSYIVPDRAPRTGHSLIDEKLHSTAGRFELTAFYDTSLNDKYVKHQGGHGSLLYHLSDWLALEFFGGTMVGKESQILSKVRVSGDSYARTSKGECGWDPLGACEPELPDLYQTTWFAGGALQWAPIYGKLSAVSEYDLSFQLYSILGAGIEGIKKELSTPGAISADYANPDGTQDGTTALSMNYGLGFRFLPFKHVAIRLELRNYLRQNPPVWEYGTGNGDKCNEGYILNDGEADICHTDWSNIGVFQSGLSVLF